jgi:hypothetical protein
VKLTEHEFRGIVALVLAVGLIVVILAMIVGVSVTGMRLNPVGSDVIIAILGAMVGALAGFIGGRVTLIPPPDDEPDAKP